MPPRGFRHTHLPLFKTERWELAKFASEVARYSLSQNITFSDVLPSSRNLVLNDIAYALEQNIVKCCVVFRVTPTNGGDDVDVQFSVEHSFWSNEDAVAELKKFLHPDGNIIPYEYFFTMEDGIKKYLVDAFACPKAERHRLQVVDPSHIFAHLVDFDPLPDEYWFARYASYRQPFTWEVLAVAWRYIAICPREKTPSISAIVDHLESYLAVEGLGMKNLPKRHKLYQIARNVRDQISRADFNSTVIVSSNPNRPQIAPANRKRVKSSSS